jgi:hypothetical protein
MKLRIRDIERERSIEIEETLPAASVSPGHPRSPGTGGTGSSQNEGRESRKGPPGPGWKRKPSLTIACARCLERYRNGCPALF